MTVPLIVYWTISATFWGVVTVAVWRYRTTNRMLAAWMIVGISLLARLVVVVTTVPTFSDDLWRYIHDGTVLGIDRSNPYGQAPIDVDPEFQGNYPDLVTIYQPASQWLFAASAVVTATVFGEAFSPDQAAMVFRMCFIGFDLVVVLLLLWCLRREGRSDWWAVLYAWHPLVIMEVAGSGHQDPLGVSMLLAAVLLCEQTKQWGVWSAIGSGLTIGGAIAVKPIIGPLMLPMFWTLKDRPRLLGWATVALAVVLVAMYMPFTLMAGGLSGMLGTAGTFVGTWSFNGSLHPLVEHWAGGKWQADTAMAVLLLAVLLGSMWAGVDLRRICGIYLLAALLFSSTAHPWYLLWALAFVPIRFDLATWVYSLTIGWSYWVLSDRWHSGLPSWLLWAEYLPVYAAVMWGLWRYCRRTAEPVFESLESSSEFSAPG